MTHYRCVPSLLGALATLLAMTFGTPAFAAPVAQVAVTTGAVSTIKPDGKRRIVSPESVLEEGDIVVTEENSTAVLAFTDGSKVALRPNSRFSINAYTYVPSMPQSDKGIFSLLKGGLRTVTGLIGKRGSRDSYLVRTETATIGIRGTEYTARVCKGDCGLEARGASVAPPPARLVSVNGVVTATTSAGGKRTLGEGAVLALGDTVETGEGAWAGIAFSDDSRIVLRARSSMRIVDFRFDAAEPARDNFAVRLVKGALRAVTGSIGKRNASRVKVEMVTSTIGIRGTKFDVWCLAVGGACDGPVLTSVREGRVVVTNAAGSKEAGAGQTAFVGSPAAVPDLLDPKVPLPADDGSPLPESLPLIGEPPAQTTGGDGVFVLVHDGRVALTQGGETIELSKNESAFAAADGSPPEKLETTPTPLESDPFLRAVDFDEVSCTLP